ncbi:MAG: PilZ domain-containing protein [Planctomycetota bacterium]
MSERRRTARDRAFYRLDVLNKRGKLVGCMADISPGGMRVRHIADDDLLAVERLTIELPRWMGLGRELPVAGRFVWYRESGGGSEGGFAFNGLSRKSNELVARLIEQISLAAREDGIVTWDQGPRMAG